MSTTSYPAQERRKPWKVKESTKSGAEVPNKLAPVKPTGRSMRINMRKHQKAVTNEEQTSSLEQHVRATSHIDFDQSCSQHRK